VGTAAVVLAWTDVGGDLSALVAIFGVVLAGLALLHVKFGLAAHPGTAVLGGLACVAVLLAPLVTSVVLLLVPASLADTGTADTGTAETGTAETGTAETGTAETGPASGVLQERSACLVDAYTTEQVNACP
jgi:hypothetical protein